jgi:hypothetical protein
MQKITRDIRDIENIINEKIDLLNGRRSIIVSIDGKDGSGKSQLALQLCCRNENFIYFDLDTHYHSSKLPYSENIDFDRLRNNINKTLVDNETVVIDGVCLLSIFEKILIQPDISIYVKKFLSGHWIDEGNFDYNLNLEEELIKKKEKSSNFSEFDKEMNSTASCGGGVYPKRLKQCDQAVETNPINEDVDDISCEIIRYHFCYKPDKEANVIYERISKPSADNSSGH